MSKNQLGKNKYTFASTWELLEFLNEELVSAVEEQPKMFLKSILLEKKDELEPLRKKFRAYDE
ncbi:hypothetical protein [Lysinibacillus sphaericus]|uniref:hypothetical protein n=1 Tax=Lysinibacillus sphaericus TaxID=1421 RepID=UPI001CBEED63|nr:hypothetical protein [Lysinibacillus sphaericus]